MWIYLTNSAFAFHFLSNEQTKKYDLIIAPWSSNLLQRKTGIRWKKKLIENRKSIQNHCS